MPDLNTLSTPLNAQTQLHVSWISGKERMTKILGTGRFLIGSSSFCHIRTSTEGTDICAILDASDNQVILRCVSHIPIIFVENRKLSPGDELLLADALEMIVGRTPLYITRPIAKGVHTHSQKGADFDESSVRRSLSKQLLALLNLDRMDFKSIESAQIRGAARLKLRKLIAENSHGFTIPAQDLEDQIFNEVFGLGPLETLLSDPDVTEIMVNARDQIFVEKAGILSLVPTFFSSDQALLHVIERIVSTVGRRIDTSSPIVDARLLDGSRINAVIPPLALRGPCLTIRRFSNVPITVKQLIQWGSISTEMAALLRHVVCERKNILISGGTGSGKTTLLNALSSFISDKERIVTVEDAAELQLQQSHVISLETRPANLEGVGAITIRDLVKNTLRMRPDRIIIGECRGAEALDMLQAMNTGHDGSMTTAHANAPEDMLRRLETMVLMTGMDLPLRAIREQIASALSIVVQQVRGKNGKRYISEVTWIKELDRSSGDYIICPLIRCDKKAVVHIDYLSLQDFWAFEELTGDPLGILNSWSA